MPTSRGLLRHCSKRKEEIRAKQTAINHLLASAMADPRQVSCLEDEKEALKQALEGHRHEAEQAHKYYVDTAKECGEEWAEIAELDGKSTLTDEEQERLAAKKIKFTIVISADYQMNKLVPYLGLSPQPGSTYYLQKLSHDIYGIVNHATTFCTCWMRE